MSSLPPAGASRFPGRVEDGGEQNRTVETLLPVVQRVVLQRRRLLPVAGAPPGRPGLSGQGHRDRRRHRVSVQRL